MWKNVLAADQAKILFNRSAATKTRGVNLVLGRIKLTSALVVVTGDSLVYDFIFGSGEKGG